MNKKDEALKLALEALESCSAGDYSTGHVIHPSFDVDAVNKAITTIREALAEQGCDYCNHPQYAGTKCNNCGREQPAQQQEPIAWVYPEGLEALKAGKPWTAYGRRQEPNNTALYLSPQPDIPPYAWVTFTPYGDEDDVWYENPEGKLLEGWTYKPLYDTTPPKRTWVGLTEQEHTDIAIQCGCMSADWVFYGATVERILKEKNLENCPNVTC